MALVAVAWPSSEPESAAMVCLLQANEIPCFVHGAGLASVLPGLQIAGYNSPTIMVPEETRALALELLSVFSNQAAVQEVQHSVGFLAKLRMILEALMFGRFVSQPSARADHKDVT